MVIITPIIIAFVWYFIGIAYYIIILFGFPIGIIIGLYGLYGVLMYKFKPEKYREILEKKKSVEPIRKKGIIKIIIGIIILCIGLILIYVSFRIMIEMAWRPTAWLTEYGFLAFGFIFFLIGLVITRSGIIDYKKK